MRAVSLSASASLLLLAAAACAPAASDPAVHVRNMQASHEAQDEMCAESGPCDRFTASFVIENAAAQPMQRLSGIEVEVGDKTIRFEDFGVYDEDAREQVPCEASPWVLEAGETSGIIDLTLEVSISVVSGTTIEYAAYVELPCGDESAYGYADLSERLDGDFFGIMLRGLYTDGAAWEANASAEMK